MGQKRKEGQAAPLLTSLDSHHITHSPEIHSGVGMERSPRGEEKAVVYQVAKDLPMGLVS